MTPPSVVVPPSAMNPGMSLNIVNVNHHISSIRKLRISGKQHAQKCPWQLLHNICNSLYMEHLTVRLMLRWMILWDWVTMNLFLRCYVSMVRIPRENGEAWLKQKKLDPSLSAYVKYVDNFRFWRMLWDRFIDYPTKKLWSALWVKARRLSRRNVFSHFCWFEKSMKNYPIISILEFCDRILKKPERFFKRQEFSFTRTCAPRGKTTPQTVQSSKNSSQKWL